jgi:hypothetical protein
MTMQALSKDQLCSRRSTICLALLFGLVFMSRLPFLDAGYGVNVDGWRVARVARDFATTGIYSVSRFPGYPLQEMTCALFWRGGPSALNGLSALFSAIAAVTFAAIARNLGCRDWFLAGLALAGTPVFFLSSVCSKDYIWALAFILLSWLCALNKRAGLAGALLGIATGCRITSAAMVLPIALIVFHATRYNWRAIAKFVIVAGSVGVVAFAPVWSRYGMEFLTFYGNQAVPDWQRIFNRGTVEVWGGVGLLALGIAVSGSLLAHRTFAKANYWTIAPLVLVVAIYTGAYLRLPDQAGYLLPIVPAILLLICLLAPRRSLQLALSCLVISSLVDFAPGGLRLGPILADRHQRLENLTNIRNLLLLTESAPGSHAFAVGALEPQIAVLAPQLLTARNHYLYVMNTAEIESALADGRSLYYFPGIRELNYRVNGIDLAKYGARDLRFVYDVGVTAQTRP